MPSPRPHRTRWDCIGRTGDCHRDSERGKLLLRVFFIAKAVEEFVGRISVTLNIY